MSTTNPNGTTFTIPPELSKSCSSPPCNVTVTIGNTTYLPGQSIPLPVGTTPLVYTITDSTGATATSPTTVVVQGPPDITAPAPATGNATSASGASFTIPPPSSETCGQPPCTVSVLFNGTLYPVGSTVQLPIGATPLTYIVTDSNGNTASDQTSATVVGPPTITAPASTSVNAYNLTEVPVTISAPASSYCGVPACTVSVLYNGTYYPVGSSVNLPVGNNTLTYYITDANGLTASDNTTVEVANSASTYVLSQPLLLQVFAFCSCLFFRFSVWCLFRLWWSSVCLFLSLFCVAVSFNYVLRSD